MIDIFKFWCRKSSFLPKRHKIWLQEVLNKALEVHGEVRWMDGGLLASVVWLLHQVASSSESAPYACRSDPSSRWLKPCQKVLAVKAWLPGDETPGHSAKRLNFRS